MGEETIWEWIKDKIAGLAFKIFLWGIDKTKEQYWTEVKDLELKLADQNGGDGDGMGKNK